MRQKQASTQPRICGFARNQFFSAFPMLAPAVDELIVELRSIKKHAAIDSFLLAFCRLFDKEIEIDDTAPIPYGSIGNTLYRMCNSGRSIRHDNKTYSLATLYRTASKEAGNFAPIFKRLVATMYERYERSIATAQESRLLIN